MSGFLDYNTSWLNPALKLAIIALYVIVAVVFLRARRSYAGDISAVLLALFWMGAAAAVAALFRYFGDGTQFGFTKELSLKWFQSLGYVLQAALFVAAAWKMSRGIIPEVRE